MANAPPAPNGTDGISEYLIPKTSKKSSNYIESLEQKQRAII
jgi:hypothetical protein